MSNSYNKKNGIYYTPPDLADFLANLIIKNPNAYILDPAFGQGALLLSARNRLEQLGNNSPNTQIFGYDIQPLCKEYQKTHFTGLLDGNNLVNTDFFDVINKEKLYDVILMNPPFVRHHELEKVQLEKIKSITDNYSKLPKTSDLWAYFIIYSLNFIKKHGSIGAILPWSFIQSDYSKIVRNILIDKFETLNVIVIGQHKFNNAQERVLIFYGDNYNNKTRKINIHYSYKIPLTNFHYTNVSRTQWCNTPVKQICAINLLSKLNYYTKKLHFQQLGDYAQIKIGTVTGANSFFILDNDTIGKLNIPRDLAQPIIKHANELQSLEIIDNYQIDNNLLLIPPNMNLPESLAEYINNGQLEGLNLGYHTKKRTCWYSIEKPTPPDGFIPYMIKEVPFITLNKSNILSTNSIHQIYFFKGVNEDVKKWIQFSILSSISQLSIELYGKTYGGGVLKIEPTSVKNIFIYAGEGKAFPVTLDKELNKFIQLDKKQDAIRFVDDWISENFDISRKELENIQKYYEFIKDMRINK